MTPGRFSSCSRLLRGITVLEARHKDVLLALIARRSALQNELTHLSKLIADQSYADTRLLLPMSRRIGTTAMTLRTVQHELVEAYRKETKLSRAKQLLMERLLQHEVDKDEEDLADLVSEMISSKASVQSTTRK
jgi:hypothetical protein